MYAAYFVLGGLVGFVLVFALVEKHLPGGDQ